MTLYMPIFLTNTEMKLFEIIYKNNYDFYRRSHWTITFSIGFQICECVVNTIENVTKCVDQIPTRPLP